ncbi:hypothetical protein N7532_008094 [Penicillium argentinense]|uniref:Uncharacterized protein n=1 Tax=Penicillium argentinense TaxID=1131581 RepID=A0A9W9EX06_9EURO|nr:uncharacterized protein N7532_008094 [Penicillium argentinense]KAJ5089410.1 hypothetical protein N7532_008094 [Penicillium argentinense]
MKASFVTLLALATAAIAAPTPAGIPGLSDLTNLAKLGDLTNLAGLDGITKNLKLGDITKELNLENLPVVSKVGDLTKILNLPSTSNSDQQIGESGHVVQDLGPELNNILTVTGPNLQTLLIKLSPEVTALVSGLGLGALGVPLGGVVASASGLGDLVTGLGPHVDGLVTVVGADVGALLIGLSPEVAGLVSGLGLPTVGIPVGTVVATLGKNLKRDVPTGKIVQNVAPQVKSTITVTGGNAKKLLIELSPSVAALLTGLGLPSAGVPLGEVVKTAADVGDLLKDISGPVEDLLTVTGKDGDALLIKLSPEVAQLVTGLGLPSIATPLGSVVETLGESL